MRSESGQAENAGEDEGANALGKRANRKRGGIWGAGTPAPPVTVTGASGPGLARLGPPAWARASARPGSGGLGPPACKLGPRCRPRPGSSSTIGTLRGRRFIARVLGRRQGLEALAGSRASSRPGNGPAAGGRQPAAARERRRASGGGPQRRAASSGRQPADGGQPPTAAVGGGDAPVPPPLAVLGPWGPWPRPMAPAMGSRYSTRVLAGARPRRRGGPWSGACGRGARSPGACGEPRAGLGDGYHAQAAARAAGAAWGLRGRGGPCGRREAAGRRLDARGPVAPAAPRCPPGCQEEKKWARGRPHVPRPRYSIKLQTGNVWAIKLW